MEDELARAKDWLATAGKLLAPTDDWLDSPPGPYAGMYVLEADGVTPRPARTHREWAEFMQGARHVANDCIGDAHISTVFLGIDHAFGGPTPILWETMIFGGEYEQAQWRYPSYELALLGHAHAIECVTGWASDPRQRAEANV